MKLFERNGHALSFKVEDFSVPPINRVLFKDIVLAYQQFHAARAG